MPLQNFLYEKLRKLILPLEQIDSNLPKAGKILDLGCGQGVIANYIAKESQRDVIGIDTNVKRLKKSNLKNLSFKSGDLTSILLPRSKGIVISDVLHHLNRQDQNKLIKKLYLSLENGGVLVIKEIDKGEFLRSSLSRLWDFLIYPKDKIYYWYSKDLTKTLKKLGFKVNFTRPCRLFPGSTTLYICVKS